MDGRSFDRLARFLNATGSRRQALLAVLGGALAGTAPLLTEARKKRRRRGNPQRRGRSGRVRSEALPSRCCSKGNCTPGRGKNLAKCCYEGQNLTGENVKGANLGSANLRGAILRNANFAGANLGKACLTEADLTGAKINGSTNLGGAIFCRTIMPDGSINNSGCDDGTACCPTCISVGGSCGAGAGGSCCGDDCLSGICPCENGMIDCDGDGDGESCGECGVTSCPIDPETGLEGHCCAGGFCSCGGECCGGPDCWIIGIPRGPEFPPSFREACQPPPCTICPNSGPLVCCHSCIGGECVNGTPIGGGSIRRR